MLPTLNESGAIGTLIGRITADYPGAEIVVVDDGSTDRTLSIVRQWVRKSKKIRIVDRKRFGLKKGLAASVIEGILDSRTKFVIAMDADMQHPPEVIAKMAAMLRNRSVVVVATRATVEGWALHRKIISKVLIWIGYLVLAVRGSETCPDIFSGYFGVDRKLFANTYRQNRSRFVLEGYKVLFDFLKCMKRGTVKLDTVPFDFQTRKTGRSKAGMAQALALLRSFLT